MNTTPTRARRTRERRPEGPDARGEEVELEVGPVAHGGHCVARHEGRVVFVRHALPGERVVARITEGAEGAKFWRADAVRVLRADPDRVEPACPVARPGMCGGCDFQHATTAKQRQLKAHVVAEQMQRLAHLDLDVTVEEVPSPGPDGLRWRTRTQFSVDDEGRTGLRAHRSHRVVPVQDCPISAEAVVGSGVLSERFGNVETVEVAAGSDGAAPLVVVTPAPGRHAHLPKLPAASVALRTPEGLHRVSGRTWVGERITVRAQDREREFAFRVGGAGFWQVHPSAPAVLGGAVLAALEPQAGESALDLYAGAGLFTALLADAVGPDGAVLAVEGDEQAVRDARRSLHEARHVELWAGAVAEALQDEDLRSRRPAVVVLDPPRAGAGRVVVSGVAALGARAIAYVACDPAALARDSAFLAEHGYVLDGLRAFDLFPQTHHVECVARFVPRS